MKKQIVMLLEKADEANVCKHYWIVDSPNGSLSKGICKECGKATEFKNSIPEYKSYGPFGNAKKKDLKKEDTIAEEAVEWIPEKVESLE